MNRKGDWVQIFLVMFFFFLIVFGLTLLFLERDVMRTHRTQTSNDLAATRVESVLLGLLRQPYPVDVNGDGVRDRTNLAEAIVRDDPANDEGIIEHVREQLGENVLYQVTITYPDRELEAHRLLPEVQDRPGSGYYTGGSEGLFRSISSQQLDAHIPTTELELPGGATVRFSYADEQIVKKLILDPDEDTEAKDIIREASS